MLKESGSGLPHKTRRRAARVLPIRLEPDRVGPRGELLDGILVISLEPRTVTKAGVYGAKPAAWEVGEPW